MIERVPIRRDETSKYYHHNVRLAEEWEKFAQKMNGTITGLVNGQTLELELNFRHKNADIIVNASRQITSISGGTTPKSNLSKHTFILFKGLNMGDCSWKIYPKHKLFHFILGLFTHVSLLPYNNNYSLLGSKTYEFNRVLPKPLFTTIDEVTDLRSIHGSSGSLKIAYFNMIGVANLQKLIKAILE